MKYKNEMVSDQVGALGEQIEIKKTEAVLKKAEETKPNFQSFTPGTAPAVQPAQTQPAQKSPYFASSGYQVPNNPAQRTNPKDINLGYVVDTVKDVAIPGALKAIENAPYAFMMLVGEVGRFAESINVASDSAGGFKKLKKDPSTREKAGEAVKKNKSFFGGMSEYGQKKMNQDTTLERNAENLAYKYKDKEISEETQFVANVATGVTQMIPMITANAVVPGSAMGYMFGQVFTNSADQASQEGASPTEAVTFGFLSASVEVGTEMLFGGIPGLPDGVLSKTLAGKLASEGVGGALEAGAKKAVKNEAVLKYLLKGIDVLGEGFEEYIAEQFGKQIVKVYKESDEQFNFFDEDAWMSFLVGMASSGVMQMGYYGVAKTMEADIKNNHVSNLPIEQQQALATALAQNYGYEVQYVNNLEIASIMQSAGQEIRQDQIVDGWMDREGRKLFINVQSNKPVMHVLKHELTHTISQFPGFEEFRDLVLKQGIDTETYNELYAMKQADYAHLSQDQAYIEEEMLADVVGALMFDDVTSIRKMAGLDLQMTQNIFDVIRDMKSRSLNGEATTFLQKVEDMYHSILQANYAMETMEIEQNAQPGAQQGKKYLLTDNQVRKTNVAVKAQNELTEAILTANTSVSKSDEGYRIDVTRYQKSKRAGEYSVRGGIFYLMDNNKQKDLQYKNQKGDSQYGGDMKVSGTVLVKNPLVIDASIGGALGRNVIEKLDPENASKIQREISLIEQASFHYIREMRVDPDNFNKQDALKNIENMVKKTFRKFTKMTEVEIKKTTDLLMNAFTIKNGKTITNAGNIFDFYGMNYALQEKLASELAIEQGYDSLIGYEVDDNSPEAMKLYDALRYAKSTQFQLEKLSLVIFDFLGEEVGANDVEKAEKLLKKNLPKTDYKFAGRLALKQLISMNKQKNEYEAQANEIIQKSPKKNIKHNEFVDLREITYPKLKDLSEVDPRFLAGAVVQQKLIDQGFDVKFALSKKSDTQIKDLVVMTNTYERSLLELLDLGGFPVPSLAITRAGIPHNDFGDITVVFKTNVGDPAKTPVFDRDAYTPRRPEVRTLAQKEDVQRAVAQLDAVLETSRDIFEMVENQTRDYTGAYHVGNYDLGNLSSRIYHAITDVKRFEGMTDQQQKLIEHMENIELSDDMNVKRNEGEKAEKIIKDILSKAFNKKYIRRSNVHALDRNGNRRKFTTLYAEYNLENLVYEQTRVKNLVGGESENLYGFQAFVAMISNKIKNVKQLKQQAKRLVYDQNTTEYYKTLEDKYAKILRQVVSDDYGFLDVDQEIIDTFQNNRNVSKSWFAQVADETFGDLATDKWVDEVFELIDEIRNIPTGYFEGKPQRAVMLDEIGYVLIPKDSSVELKNKLEEAMIEYIEYNPANVRDFQARKMQSDGRTEIIQNRKDYQFSLSRLIDEQLSKNKTGMDNKERRLSPEQYAFFVDSKIVDQQGNLKTMYHGTYRDFSTFDIFASTLDNSYGAGFYFTDSESQARPYGDNVKEVYLNIKKPLYRKSNEYDTGQKTMDRKTWMNMSAEFYITTQSKMTTDFETYMAEQARSIDMMLGYRYSDVSMYEGANYHLSKYLQKGYYDPALVTKLFSKYTGYDGLIRVAEGEAQFDIIVAFKNSAIKLVDNTKPTTDEDIRFSVTNLFNSGIEAYFKDSKIRDEDGELIKVYHGTAKQFDQFSDDVYSTWNRYEKGGYYFTPVYQTAEYFAKTPLYDKQGDYYGMDKTKKGFIKEVYLDITNPLDFRNLTDEQIRQIMKLAPDDYKDWTFDQFEYYLNAPNPELTKTLLPSNLTMFEMFGYDGVIFRMPGIDFGGQVEYVAFKPEQIKYVDNFSPTNHPDMRFSVSKINDQNLIIQQKNHPGFYSKLRNLIADSFPDTIMVGSAINKITGAVKAEEYKWSGLQKHLEGLNVMSRITKEELFNVMDDNILRIEKTFIGAPRNNEDGSPEYNMYQSYAFGNVNYGELGVIVDRKDLLYRSPHWMDENVVVHFRKSEVYAPDVDKPVFLIEEIQSDIHQKGRQEGYKDEAFDLSEKRLAEIDAEQEEGINKLVKKVAPKIMELFEKNNGELSMFIRLPKKMNENQKQVIDQDGSIKNKLKEAGQIITHTHLLRDMAKNKKYFELLENNMIDSMLDAQSSINASIILDFNFDVEVNIYQEAWKQGTRDFDSVEFVIKINEDKILEDIHDDLSFKMTKYERYRYIADALIFKREYMGGKWLGSLEHTSRLLEPFMPSFEEYALTLKDVLDLRKLHTERTQIKNKMKNDQRVPDFPFKDGAYLNLGMVSAIRHAIQEGHKRVYLTSRFENAKRYGRIGFLDSAYIHIGFNKEGSPDGIKIEDVFRVEFTFSNSQNKDDTYNNEQKKVDIWKSSEETLEDVRTKLKKEIKEKVQGMSSVDLENIVSNIMNEFDKNYAIEGRSFTKRIDNVSLKNPLVVGEYMNAMIQYDTTLISLMNKLVKPAEEKVKYGIVSKIESSEIKSYISNAKKELYDQWSKDLKNIFNELNLVNHSSFLGLHELDYTIKYYIQNYDLEGLQKLYTRYESYNAYDESNKPEIESEFFSEFFEEQMKIHKIVMDDFGVAKKRMIEKADRINSFMKNIQYDKWVFFDKLGTLIGDLELAKMDKYHNKSEYFDSTLTQEEILALKYPLDRESKNMRVFPYIELTDKVKEIFAKDHPLFSLTTKDSEGRDLNDWQKEFFMGSKVVDDQNRLKVMYHGTKNYGFAEFGGKATTRRLAGANFFTDNKEISKSYTRKDSNDADILSNDADGQGQEGRSGIYEVYLNIKNPVVIDAKDASWSMIKVDMNKYPELSDLYRSNRREDNIVRVSTDMIYDAVIVANRLKSPAEQYDGLIIENLIDMGGMSTIKADRLKDGKLSATVAVAFLPESIKQVNNETPTTNPDIRFSLEQDSNKNKLSEEQVEFFKESKVRNKDGKLLMVYHGTENEFTKFDKNAIGNNFNQDEKGFFFTDDFRKAEDYANFTSFGSMRKNEGIIMKSYLNIVNPLIVKIDYDSIDYWDNNFEYLLKRAEKLNNDGIIIKASKYDSLYIVFEPNQIKSVDNYKPTTNPDIRFAVRRWEDPTLPDYARLHGQIGRNFDKYPFDRTILEGAEKFVPPTRSGNRTKEKWLDLAKMIGMNMQGKDPVEVGTYAMQSWYAMMPQRNMSKQGKSFVKFPIGDWMQAVYDGAIITEENQPDFRAKKQAKKQLKRPKLLAVDDFMPIVFDERGNPRRKFGNEETVNEFIKRVFIDTEGNYIDYVAKVTYDTNEDYEMREAPTYQWFDQDGVLLPEDSMFDVMEENELTDADYKGLEAPEYAIDQGKLSDDELRELLDLENMDQTSYITYKEKMRMEDLYAKREGKKLKLTETDLKTKPPGWEALTLQEKNEIAHILKVARKYGELPSEMHSRANELMAKMDAYVPPVNDTPPIKDVPPVTLKKSSAEMDEEAKIRVRKHQQTIRDSGHVDQGTIDGINKGMKDGEFNYVVASDVDAVRHANGIINISGRDEAYNRIHYKFNSDDVITKNDVALGEILIVEFTKTGQAKEVANLIMDLAIHGTQTGQALQAMSLIKKFTPAGQLVTLQRIVNKLKRDHLARTGKELNIVMPEQLMLKLLHPSLETSINNEEAVNEIIDNIKSLIADQLPVTAMDKLNAWRYMSMLGNPRTHIRNILGNSIFMPMGWTKDIVGQLLESAFIKDPADRTKSLVTHWSDPALWEFARADFEEVKDVIQAGGKYDLRRSLLNERKIFNTKWLEAIRKMNFDLLEFMDVIALRHHYTRNLAGFIKAKGWDYKEISTNVFKTEELQLARNYAILEAQRMTFRDASALASALTRIESKGGVAGLAISAIVPFKKTPVNIMKRGYEYSPLGLTSALSLEMSKYHSGKITQAQLIDKISMGLTGTGIALLGAFMASMGWISGGNDDEETGRKKEFDRMLGKQRFSLNFEGATYTIDWAVPAVMPLVIGASIQDMLMRENEGTLFNIVPDALVNIFDPMFELTMLQGVMRTAQSFSGSGSAMAGEAIMTATTNYFGQYIPTFTGQIARTIDPVRRSTFAPKDSPITAPLENFLRRMANKLPFLTSMNNPMIDLRGEEMRTQEDPFSRAFMNMISPGFIADRTMTAEDAEMDRVYKQTGDTNVLPRTAPKSFTFEGESFILNNDEYENFSRMLGTTSYDMIKELNSSEMYKNASDGEKSVMIYNIHEYSYKKAKDTILAGRGITYDDETYVKIRDAEAVGVGVVDYYKARDIYNNTSATPFTPKKSLVMRAYKESGYTYEQAYYLMENVGNYKMNDDAVYELKKLYGLARFR